MPHPEIVISLRSGGYLEVYVSDPEIEVIVVDWDVEGVSPDDERVVRASHNHRLLQAFVSRPNPTLTRELAGSETESLIEAAEQRDIHHEFST